MSNYWKLNEEGIIPFVELLKKFTSWNNDNQNSVFEEIKLALEQEDAKAVLPTLSLEIANFSWNKVDNTPTEIKLNFSPLEFLITQLFDKKHSESQCDNLITIINIISKKHSNILNIPSTATGLIPLHFLLTTKFFNYQPYLTDDNEEKYNKDDFIEMERLIVQIIPSLITTENINKTDQQGFTALQHACNLPSILDDLNMQTDSQIYVRDKETSLFSEKIVVALLNACGIDVNTINPYIIKTALILAIENRITAGDYDHEREIEGDIHDTSKKIIAALVNANAQITMQYPSIEIYDDAILITPLHYAVCAFDYDHLKIFIQSPLFSLTALYQQDAASNTVIDLLLDKSNTAYCIKACYLILRRLRNNETDYITFINNTIRQLDSSINQLNKKKAALEVLDKNQISSNEKKLPKTKNERINSLKLHNEKLKKFLEKRILEYQEFTNTKIHWTKSFNNFCYRTSRKKFYLEGQDLHFLLKAKRSIVSKEFPDTHVATAALTFFVTSTFGKADGTYTIDLGKKFNEHISDLVSSKEYITHLETHLKEYENQDFFVNKKQTRKVTLTFSEPSLSQNFNHSEQAAFKWLLESNNLDAIVTELKYKIDDEFSIINEYKVKAVVLSFDSELYMCHHCQPMALALQKNQIFVNQLLNSLRKQNFNMNNATIAFAVALSAEKPYVFGKHSKNIQDYRFAEDDHKPISIDLRLLPSEHLFLKDTHTDELNISAFFSRKDPDKTKLIKKITNLENEIAALKTEIAELKNPLSTNKISK